MEFIKNLEWFHVIILCATLGLAPFTPPHIYEKLVMLFNGKLVKPIDIFDFIMHAVPWIILIIKVGISVKSA
ncbi:MAG: RND transporter [Bdellovibrionaceae bacterium]|jgi:hypothetical protein|nr:RND transporter [Pseudobdellovibrionaceae bacterium]